MYVLKSTPYDEAAMLISSTAVETYAAWLIGTTYAKDDRVVQGQYIYESLIDTNLGNSPDASPTTWLKVGPDNTYAMFDNQISTQTTSTSPLEAVVKTGMMDTLYVGNISATEVTLTVRDGLGGSIIYESTKSTYTEYISDWYAYFYDPFDIAEQVLFTNIPPYSNSYAYLDVVNVSSDVKVGIVTFGRIEQLGTTEYGANAGIIDYSVKETDEFGNTTFIQRAFSKRMTARVWVENYRLNRIQRVLYSLRSVPSLWIGTQDDIAAETLTVFGFYRDFSTDVAYATVSYCSLEIEGLI